MFFEYAPEMIKGQFKAQIITQYGKESLEGIEKIFNSVPKTDSDYLKYYELYMPKEFSDSTYEENLKALGYVNLDTPTYISIYVNSFDNKDKINEIIAKYNEGVSEEDQIKYTDYFAFLMSGISTVINAISYVLIAFVAISLVVSSIMIGIITYISVLERTKEIGILRAIGASKKDIARVFNAETLTVGLVAGFIGIIVTLLLLIPINAIIHAITDIPTFTAFLPIGAAVILVLISMALTVIAGLFPSRVAAKKDPVVALRTE
jgi:putative ABC transport system permease protein